MYSHVTENNIVIFNDGSGTRSNLINIETSSIDLCLVRPLISPHCTWFVDQTSTQGSDQFVVNVKTSSKPMVCNDNNNSFNWNYTNADGGGLANACDKNVSNDLVSDNIQETTSLLTMD